MAIKTFTTGEVLTASDTNTYLANSGLVFVKQQTISGTGITIENCFNSNFDSYKVVITGLTSSTVDDVVLRFVTGSTPNTSNLYYSARLTSAASTTSTNNAPATVGYCGLVGNTVAAGGVLEIQSPYSNTQETTFMGQGMDTRTGGSFIRFGAGFYNATTRFDGLFLGTFNGTYTMGGIVRVYGYRQS